MSRNKKSVIPVSARWVLMVAGTPMAAYACTGVGDINVTPASGASAGASAKGGTGSAGKSSAGGSGKATGGTAGSSAGGRGGGGTGGKGGNGGTLGGSSGASDGGAGASGAGPTGGVGGTLGGSGEAGGPAGAGGVVYGEPALGQPCPLGGVHSCDGAAQLQKLICFGGIWNPNGSCGTSERCVRLTGDCKPFNASCDSVPMGEKVCQSGHLLTCSGDATVTADVNCGGDQCLDVSTAGKPAYDCGVGGQQGAGGA